MGEIDPRIIEFGRRYLERRLPLTQLDHSEEDRRNIVSDLMFFGRYLQWIERPEDHSSPQPKNPGS